MDRREVFLKNQIGIRDPGKLSFVVKFPLEAIDTHSYNEIVIMTTSDKYREVYISMKRWVINGAISSEAFHQQYFFHCIN